jgi:hypothetical protein
VPACGGGKRLSLGLLVWACRSVRTPSGIIRG